MASIDNVNNIVNANGIYVVGPAPSDSSSIIEYSTDLAKWTVVDLADIAGVGSQISGIYVLNGEFFVTLSGTNNVILRSVNAVNWFNVYSAPFTTFAFLSMAFGNGVYVACSYNNSTGENQFLISEDTSSWSPVTVVTDKATFEISPFRIVFDGVKFVAVYAYAPLPQDESTLTGLMTSTDGQNWTLYQVPYVTSNGQVFQRIACDYNSLSAVVWNSGDFYHSTDITNGSSWTLVSSAISDLGNLKFVNGDFGNSYYILGADSGSVIFRTSPDGTTWTDHTYPYYSQLVDILYNGTYVLLGNGNTIGGYYPVEISKVGNNFTSYTPYFPEFYKLTQGPNTIVGVGDYGAIASSTDGGSTWNYSPSLVAVTDYVYFYGAAYGNNTYVIAGYQYVDGNDSAIFATSTDGATWVEVDMTGIAHYDFRSLIYANGLFIALTLDNDNSGHIITSSDGLNWTERHTITDGTTYNQIAYVNSLLIAPIAVSTEITELLLITSSDGLNWTEYNVGEIGTNVGAIAYGNGTYVVPVQSSGTTYILTSTDAITWEIVATLDYDVYSLAYGNNQFVGVGNNGNLFKSSDTISWSLTNIGIADNLNLISNINGRFFVYSMYNLDNPLLSSADGDLWYIEVFPNSTSVIYDLIFKSPNTYISVGTNSLIFSKSNNTPAITPSATPILSATPTMTITPSHTPDAPVYGNVIAIGSSDTNDINNVNLLMQSSDGNTFTRTGTLPDTQYSTITYSPQLDLYVAAGSGSRLGYSTDALTWTAHNFSIIGGDVDTTNIIWSSYLNKFYICGTNVYKVASSDDGLTWTNIYDIIDSRDWYGIAYSPSLNVMVVVGDSDGTNPGGVAYSTNAESNWTYGTLPKSGRFYNVIWVDDLSIFIAAGTSGVCISSDGINWTGYNVTANVSDVRDIAYARSSGMLIAVGPYANTTSIYRSTDNGQTWTACTVPAPINGANISSVTWSETLDAFFAIANAGSYNFASRSVMRSYDGITWTALTSQTNTRVSWTQIRTAIPVTPQRGFKVGQLVSLLPITNETITYVPNSFTRFATEAGTGQFNFSYPAPNTNIGTTVVVTVIGHYIDGVSTGLQSLTYGGRSAAAQSGISAGIDNVYNGNVSISMASFIMDGTPLDNNNITVDWGSAGGLSEISVSVSVYENVVSIGQSLGGSNTEAFGGPNYPFGGPYTYDEGTMFVGAGSFIIDGSSTYPAFEGVDATNNAFRVAYNMIQGSPLAYYTNYYDFTGYRLLQGGSVIEELFGNQNPIVSSTPTPTPTPTPTSSNTPTPSITPTPTPTPTVTSVDGYMFVSTNGVLMSKTDSNVNTLYQPNGFDSSGGVVSGGPFKATVTWLSGNFGTQNLIVRITGTDSNGVTTEDITVNNFSNNVYTNTGTVDFLTITGVTLLQDAAGGDGLYAVGTSQVVSQGNTGCFIVEYHGGIATEVSSIDPITAYPLGVINNNVDYTITIDRVANTGGRTYTIDGEDILLDVGQNHVEGINTHNTTPTTINVAGSGGTTPTVDIGYIWRYCPT